MQYCYEAKLSFLDSANSSNFPYQKSLEKEIKKALTNYKKIDIKKEVLQNLKDQLPSNFFDNEDITLFSVTKIGYSLKFTQSSYLGGAHPNYYERLTNFDKNGNEIKLSDIVLDMKNFTKEALKIYKKQHNLKADEPLTKDNWFDNKFVLAKEFAITNNGLFFLYNTYEIKAYAYGTTKLFIPYSRVKKYLNLNLLASLLKEKQKAIFL